jgi:hypothetical protein
VSASARVLGPLLLVLMLVVTACGAGSSGPATSGPPDASPAPSLDVIDAEVCEATFAMEDSLVRVKAIKVRRGTRGRLEQALQSVLTGQDALLQRAPYQMRTRLRTLGLAVTNLTLAIEDVRTTARIDTAASHVKRSATSLGKAIDSFQRWVGCGRAPTDEADASPGPDASPAPSVEG